MRIACLGAGRMGRGIAVVFAFAGFDVTLFDMKPRPEFSRLAEEAMIEVNSTLAMLARIGMMKPENVATIASRVSVAPFEQAGELVAADIVFEGVPEIVGVKLEALAHASQLTRPDAIIASTTSTILVDELAPGVGNPERFLNAHWLNPAFLIPLSKSYRREPEQTPALPPN